MSQQAVNLEGVHNEKKGSVSYCNIPFAKCPKHIQTSILPLYLTTTYLQYFCPGCGVPVHGRYYFCNTNSCTFNKTLEVTQIRDEFENQMVESIATFRESALKNYAVDREYVLAWLLEVLIASQIYKVPTLATVKSVFESALESNPTESCTDEFIWVVVKLLTTALSKTVTQQELYNDSTPDYI